MSHDVMLMIGNFAFTTETATYETLSRTTSWRWAKTDLIGNTPSYQFVGEGDQTISISGAIYPYQFGKQASIDTLKLMAKAGEAYLIVNKRGSSLGYWIIQSVSENESRHFADGTPRKNAFSLSLAYAGEYSLTGTNSNLDEGISTIKERTGGRH